MPAELHCGYAVRKVLHCYDQHFRHRVLLYTAACHHAVGHPIVDITAMNNMLITLVTAYNDHWYY